MNIPTKKLKSGLEMSVLGFGTWTMGGKGVKAEKYNEEKDILAIQETIKLGMNRFDTAEIYADGYSEEILGRAIKKYDRSKLFITSKVSTDNLKFDDVLKSAEGSLKRMGMDYMDLYLLHGSNPQIPIKETMKAMDQLKERGLAKNIGVANFSVDSFKRAQDVSKNKIVLNQVHYNLIFREPALAGVLEYCQNNDVFLEAWRPVQEGRLAKPGIKVLDEMSEKYEKTQAQIAINWLISQKNVITLFKASNVDHIKENLGAIGWEMGKEDIEKLASDFPVQLDRSNAVRLG